MPLNKPRVTKPISTLTWDELTYWADKIQAERDSRVCECNHHHLGHDRGLECFGRQQDATPCPCHHFVPAE